MKVLVTGAGGQLGYDVVNELASRGHEVVGTDLVSHVVGIADGSVLSHIPYIQMDLTDSEALSHTIATQRPDAVIHCAGWTAVDAAEEKDKRDLVFAINVNATRHIAEACNKIGCKMMYISTDYVFDGQGTRPWQADCQMFSPLNVYGQSKLEGEKAVKALLERFFIVRIEWAFGLNGKNFVRTMLHLGQTHDSLRVVNDQIGTPTYTLDLARLLVDMIKTERYGVYHASNEGGYISWAEFAESIFQEAGMTTRVIPVTTAQYGESKAARPFNSRLDKSKLIENGFTPLPEWRDALHRYISALRGNEKDCRF